MSKSLMPDSFADALAAEPDLRFSEWLRRRTEPTWTAATTHRFTRELADGTLDEAVFTRYLIQDYAFVETLVTTVAFGAAYAPTMIEKKPLAQFLAMVTSDENTYFLRSFEALGVPESDQRHPALAPVTAGFAGLMGEATHGGTYARVLAVLLPVEWVYMTWGVAEQAKTPDQFYYREWIDLHHGAYFEGFVGWMRSELDRIGPELPAVEQMVLADLFARAIDLEVDFFETPYAD